MKPIMLNVIFKYIRWLFCSLIGHTQWIYTAGGGFCDRCVNDFFPEISKIHKRQLELYEKYLAGKLNYKELCELLDSIKL